MQRGNEKTRMIVKKQSILLQDLDTEVLLIIGLHSNLELEVFTCSNFSKRISLGGSSVTTICDHVLGMAASAASKRLITEVISVLCNKLVDKH
jgi:predicted nucleic acid-binding Zn finger protein